MALKKKPVSKKLKENDNQYDPQANRTFAPGQERPGVDVSPVTKVPGIVNQDSKVKLMARIATNMLSGAKVRMMLAGETGIGKTSFVRDFCQMLGLPIIILEVPHTVEEHLVNIPYIIEINGKSYQGSETVDTNKKQYGIELAKSHLISQMEKLHKVPDAQYSQLRQTFNADVQELLNGFEQRYPGQIAKIRSKYDRVLFLDEYFRQTSTTIRNTLRNILDHRIGNDPIPRGTYVMYASNIKDTGLEQSETAHATFKEINFEAPTVSAWMNRMISSVGKSINLKKDVVDAFMQALKDEHMDTERFEGKTRISPRRWSEVLMQINDAYPFSSIDEANKLQTLLKRQFQNEDDKSHGPMTDVYDVLNNVLFNLYKKSGIDAGKVRDVPVGEWRDVVAYHVMQKERIGENKKYVPVMAGPPGIGKTAIGDVFEEPPYNMRFIVVNCTGLSSDSVTGIPMGQPQADAKGQNRTETEFSEPALYIQITKLMEQHRDAYYEDLKEQEAEGELGDRTADQAFQEWQNQRYRYVIFFDEINRVPNTATFNSLRQLILEKKYNHLFFLNDSAVNTTASNRPGDGVICLGAMNPKDQGTIGMTEHFKDAVDIIDSEPDWANTIAHLGQVAERLKEKGRYRDEAVDTAFKLIEEFPKIFTQKEKGGKQNYQFFPREMLFEFYVSPRDYTELFKDMCYSIDREIDSIISREQRGEYVSEEEQSEMLTDVCYDHFEETLQFIIRKSGQVSDEWWETLRSMIRKNISIKIKKETGVSGLTDIMDAYIANPGESLFDLESGVFSAYLNSVDDSAFQTEFTTFLESLTKDYLNKKSIRLDEAEPFLIGKEHGSLYDIVKAVIEVHQESEVDVQVEDGLRNGVDYIMNMANYAISSMFNATPDQEEQLINRLANSYIDIIKML